MMGGLEERLSFLMGQQVPVSPPSSPSSGSHSPPSPQDPKDHLAKDEEKGKLMKTSQAVFSDVTT